MKRFRKLAAMASITACAATSGVAQTQYTCASFQNQLLNTANPAFSPTVTVSVDAGDTITIDSILVNPSFPNINSGTAVSISQSSGAEQNCGFNGASDCAGTSFTSPIADIITIELIWTQFPGSDGAGAFFSCSQGSASGGVTPSPTVVTTTRQVAGTAGSSQGQVTGAAIGNALRATMGGAGSTVLSTRQFGDGLQVFAGTEGGLQFWGGLTGRRYSGNLDGSGFDFVAGAHMTSGNLRYGLALSYGALDVSANGLDYDVRSLAVGPYLAYQIDNVFSVDGYLMFARPDYRVSGTRFEAERIFGAVTARAQTTHSWGDLISSFGVSGYRENLPAHTIGLTTIAAQDLQEVTGFADLRAEFNPIGDIAPYLSVRLNANRFDDGTGARTYYTSPRYGAGFSWAMGSGTLTLSLDGGEVTDGTNDIGGVVTFRTSF